MPPRHGGSQKFESSWAYQNLGSALIELFLIFSLITPVTGQLEPVVTAKIDYEFNSITGCYLSGIYELERIRNSDLFYTLPPNIHVTFACQEQYNIEP